MIKRFALLALAGSLALVAASNYRVSIYQSSSVNGMELKRGDVTLELKDNKAVLKQGKNTVEASVKVETGTQKYQQTQVGYKEGSHEIKDITLGGTTTKILFDSPTISSVR
jgi:hypothetical protein